MQPSSVKQKDQLIGDVNKKVISDHTFEWENKILICSEKKCRVLKIKETIHSISDNNHIIVLYIVFHKSV